MHMASDALSTPRHNISSQIDVAHQNKKIYT